MTNEGVSSHFLIFRSKKVATITNHMKGCDYATLWAEVRYLLS